MIGDKLVIHQGHRKAAHQIMERLILQIIQSQVRFIITIAGESGSGKSEIASVISELLSEKEIKSIILQQDDYFVYPPKTNDRKRRENIKHVGASEVKLDLLDKNLKDIKEGKDEIEKPLIIYYQDLIKKETIKLEGIKVVIVEGTYTSLLENVDRHIFIDRTHIDTKEVRKERAREEQDQYLEKVLEIEHEIISAHKIGADIIVGKNYDLSE